MNRLIATADRFSFPARELSEQLLEQIQNGKVGYWEHQFDRLAGREQALHWNLATANGQILYAGNRLWSVQSLMRVVYRYAIHTRNDLVKPIFEQLKDNAEAQGLNPAQLLAEMKKIGIVSDVQLAKALKTKVLNDLDIYLLMGSGNATFVVDRDLPLQLPSMNLIPILDRQALAKANLPAGQQQRIENLVKSRLTLNSLAEEMAKDTLEIAEMFAKLAKMGLVTLQAPRRNTPAPIMVVDDSPMILSQFQHWVEKLGYPVAVCQQPETALAAIVEAEPAAIFIDINMPGISGFELVKQIRKQPQLAEIPLIILTGEQKLSNRWRAQWSGCDFLTKPLTSEAMVDFPIQLEELLLKLVGTAEPQSNQNYSLN
jgi:CheY-like chemotaxis protein